MKNILITMLALCAVTCAAQNILSVNRDDPVNVEHAAQDLAFWAGGTVSVDEMRSAITNVDTRLINTNVSLSVDWDLVSKHFYEITYYTNVVESDNHQGSQYGGNVYTLEIKPANWVYPGTYVAPTERTWTTNVVEHLIVTLRINGEQRVLVQERQVSSTSYTEILRQEWIPKPRQ